MPKLSIQRVTLFVVLLFIVAGVLIVVFDWADIWLIIGRANWLLLAPSFLLTGLSYTCLSYALVVVFRAFDVRLKIKDLMEISFVSNVVTYLMNVGGMTGMPLQFLLMKKRGVATEDILAPSLFQLYFSGLMLIALLPIGLFNILTTNTLYGNIRLSVGIAAGIITFLLIGAGVLVFVKSVRSPVLHGLSRLIRFVARRDVTSALDDFDRAMTRGVALIHRHPVVLVMLIVLTVVDWSSTIAALWFCFYALGNPVTIGILLTGFSLGVTIGFISLVPGGLGVQEASMAGIYALLGVPFGAAVLAAILFRVVYYFIPFLVSLGFYRRLLKVS
jgi:uncharacterized protein (TIRG00374 family)